MKKKILFVALFLATLLCADLLVGASTRLIIAHAPQTQYNLSNTIQTLFHQRSDILILGASRAHHSFDPRIIRQETGLTCFNGGRSGVKMDYFDLCVSSCLKRYAPRMIILDISSDMMETPKDDQFRNLRCLYGLCGPLTEAMDSVYSPLERLKLRSALYRNNRVYNEVLQLCLSKQCPGLCGYQPLSGEYRTPHELSTMPFRPDAARLSKLDDIVSLCRSHNVRLVVTYAPTLRLTTRGVSQWLSHYCKDRHIPYYDYSWEKKYYLHPELFKDEVHLNSHGAEIFTREFIPVIKANVCEIPVHCGFPADGLGQGVAQMPRDSSLVRRDKVWQKQ